MNEAPDAPAESPPAAVENVPDTPWDCRVVAPGPVRAVSAANGLVVAAGAALHQLRPGSKRLRTVPLPEGPGEVVAVIAEPWSPFRVAVAWSTKVGILSGHQPYDPSVAIQLKNDACRATHLAWNRHQGASMLYVRQRSGEVTQVNLDTASVGTLTLPQALAIASDAKGVLGVLVASEENEGLMNLQVLPAGEKAWDVYGLDCQEHPEDDPEAGRLHLDVFGTAVAIGADGYSGEVSWKPEEEGWLDLQMPPAVFHGPYAFRSEKEIFAACNIEGQVSVRRYVRGQALVTRVARFGLDDQWKGAEATVTSIAWDEERRTLWAASPELGLMALTEPQ